MPVMTHFDAYLWHTLLFHRAPDSAAGHSLSRRPPLQARYIKVNTTISRGNTQHGPTICRSNHGIACFQDLRGRPITFPASRELYSDAFVYKLCQV